MYWVWFFDGSSKILSEHELNAFLEDDRDSIVEIKDMNSSIILDTQTYIYQNL